MGGDIIQMTVTPLDAVQRLRDGQHSGGIVFPPSQGLSVLALPAWGPLADPIALFRLPFSSRKTGALPRIPSGVCSVSELFLGVS